MGHKVTTYLLGKSVGKKFRVQKERPCERAQYWKDGEREKQRILILCIFNFAWDNILTFISLFLF